MVQDILITPSSGEPQILFRGSGVNDTSIELNVLSSYQSASGSGTALIIQGTEGQLLGITDNLSSGTIYNVGDIAGFPLIEATASGNVSLVEFGGGVGIGTGINPRYQLDVNGTGNFTAITFNISTSGNEPAYQESLMFYDDNNKTISMYNEVSGVSLQMGQETYMRARNISGSTINNGQAVYITGSQGTHITIALAISSGYEQSHSVGLATHDINNNSFGYVTTLGVVRDIDTSNFSEGEEVYLSQIVPGGLTGVLPLAPNFQTEMGYVVRSHTSNGSIFIDPSHSAFGGFGVKTDSANVSGIPFFSVARDGHGLISSDTGFVYDSGNARLGIERSTPQYTLDINGIGNFESGVRFSDGTIQTTAGGSVRELPYVLQTGNYTIPATGYGVFISASGSSIITLPDSSTIGRAVNIIRTDDSGVYIVNATGAAGELINNSDSLSIAISNSVDLVSNGTNWYIK